MAAVNTCVGRLTMALINRQGWSWSGGPSVTVRPDPASTSAPVVAPGVGEAVRIGRTGGFTPAGFSVINTATVLHPFESSIRTDYSNMPNPPLLARRSSGKTPSTGPGQRTGPAKRVPEGVLQGPGQPGNRNGETEGRKLKARPEPAADQKPRQGGPPGVSRACLPGPHRMAHTADLHAPPFLLPLYHTERISSLLIHEKSANGITQS